MGADYSFDVKNIDIWVPTFFRHNNLFIATVVMIQMADYKSYTNGTTNKKYLESNNN